jgi:hypothetical protein
MRVDFQVFKRYLTLHWTILTLTLGSPLNTLTAVEGMEKMSAEHKSRLQDRRAALLQGIGAAATSGDSKNLLRLTEQLRQVELLISRIDSLAAEAEAFLEVRPGTPKSEAPIRNLQLETTEPRIPGRGYGAEIRAAFVRSARERGLDLAPLRGAVFSTDGGQRVGIAVATERQRDRWFLGLPEDGFDAAVLLCQTNAGKVLEVCLPNRFFERFRSVLSKSGGQVKFNVVRRDGHLFVTLPGRSPFQVDDLVGDISQVRRSNAAA